MPKVSVVIPTHNRAELLRLAITSVLNQTFQDFEVIIVDDASSDNTHEVVSDFNDSRIKYIRHETNKGDSTARNSGIIASNGKYIGFLDDDDEWLPEKLTKQVDLLENSSSRVGGVYTGTSVVDKTSRKILAQNIPTKRGNLFKDMLMVNFITTSTLLLKRECFNSIGLFDESVPYCSDYDLWIRISREFYFECIKEPLVRYSIHHGNRLTNNHGKVIVGIEAIIKKYDQLLALNRKSYSHLYLALGVRYNYSGNAKKGRKAFLQAIKLYPFEIRHYFNLGLSLVGTHAFKKIKEAKEKLSIQMKLY